MRDFGNNTSNSNNNNDTTVCVSTTAHVASTSRCKAAPSSCTSTSIKTHLYCCSTVVSFSSVVGTGQSRILGMGSRDEWTMEVVTMQSGWKVVTMKTDGKSWQVHCAKNIRCYCVLNLYAAVFDQDFGSWNVSRVTCTNYMFTSSCGCSGTMFLQLQFGGSHSRTKENRL